jgi:hypothetical protein
MADLPLTVGAVVGVLLSGGFVLAEIGRYATPQVPETLFDERREVFAYTAGLFVGIPLALCLLFFLDSMGNGAIPGAILWLVALVAGTEVAQWALMRTRYWGLGESGPFYALGYRAGIGGIFGLTVVAQYLSGPAIVWAGAAVAVAQAAAVLGLEVTGALLSLPPSEAAGRRGGGPLPAAVFGAVGFFLVGLGPLAAAGSPGDETVPFAAAAVALIGTILVYRRLRPILASVPPPTAGGVSPARRAPGAYGRTDQGPDGPPP